MKARLVGLVTPGPGTSEYGAYNIDDGTFLGYVEKDGTVVESKLIETGTKLEVIEVDETPWE